MGTSSPFGGATNDRPLVPSWVEDPTGTADGNGGGDGADDGADDGGTPGPGKPPLPPPGPLGRFTGPRAAFTSFARSGGTDRRSLGRAVSGYVRSSMGSPRRAAQRMSTAAGGGVGLVRVLQGFRADGVVETLRRLNLAALAGRPIEEIFAGLVDYICPEGGSIDEGIARDAFVETIADLAAEGITDVDGLTSDQMTTIFELYVAHTIEARICNDIGTKAVTMPTNPAAAQRVADMLHDFIERGVADAVASAGTNIQSLSPDDVRGFVEGVYTSAFEILRAMGDQEANR